MEFWEETGFSNIKIYTLDLIVHIGHTSSSNMQISDRNENGFKIMSPQITTKFDWLRTSPIACWLWWIIKRQESTYQNQYQSKANIFGVWKEETRHSSKRMMITTMMMIPTTATTTKSRWWRHCWPFHSIPLLCYPMFTNKDGKICTKRDNPSVSIALFIAQ